MMGSDSAAIHAFESLPATSSSRPPAWVLRELPSEEPAHPVRISRGFWIDTYEVTNRAFAAFVAAGGYDTRRWWSEAGWAWRRQQPRDSLPRPCDRTGPDHPRACVTWYEAEAYAAWRGGRLPTEAEWEYAARGPESRVYPWGDAWDSARANVVGSTEAVPVGSYPRGASWAGAQDLAGNVMEWVSDWLDVSYYQGPGPWVDPTGPATGEHKVEKGGWWGSNPYVARPAYRHFEDPPEYGDHHIGFRVVTR